MSRKYIYGIRRKHCTATLRGGILFRLVAVLLTSKRESVSERKKVRRLDNFARQVNDVLVDSSVPTLVPHVS